MKIKFAILSIWALFFAFSALAQMETIMPPSTAPVQTTTPPTQETTPAPTEKKEFPYFEIKGMWNDVDGRGFYRFDEDEFIFQTPDGVVNKGTYRELERDADGNRQFSGKMKLQKENDEVEEVNVFVRFYANGTQGLFQQKCMKHPFYRSGEL